MNKAFFLTIVFSIIFQPLFSQDSIAIQKVFDQYIEAVQNEEGYAAAELLDSTTVQHFQMVLDKILYADSLAIDSMEVISKYQILLNRERIPKDELIGLSGKDLVATSVTSNRLFDSDYITIDHMDVDSNIAKVYLIIERRKSYPMHFLFIKENENWKFNMTSLFEMMSQPFQMSSKAYGMTENEVILHSIENSTGHPPSDDIWEPLLNAKKD